MTPQPKRKLIRDPKYLSWIRTLPCAICGKPAPSEAMHQRCLGGGGMGLKPSDHETLPGCKSVPDRIGCHMFEQQFGFLLLWEERGGIKFADKIEMNSHISTLCQTLKKTYEKQT